MMDISAFFKIFSSTNNPLLPHASLMALALYGIWAIVLGCATLLLTRKLARPYQLGLSLLVVVLTLVPGTTSPAYWLGLSFQTPSLTSGMICGTWALGCLRNQPGRVVLLVSGQSRAVKILSLLGVVLGWVLLLDTLACFPTSVYAWGFSSAAVFAVLVTAALFWVIWGDVTAHRMGFDWLGPLLMLSVLALFVLTRLPTGNVWDALMDPWLWVALQMGWLFTAARRLKRWLFGSPAIRA
jgi:hypothetical protein